MAGLIYYDTNTYAVADLYGVLKAIPNFWDETDDETSALTKGGITLTLGSTKTMSGYGQSITITTLFGSNISVIAATNKGLVFLTTGNGKANAFALGCDADESWGGSTGSASSSAPTVSNIIANGVSATTYSTNTTTESTINTQIIDLSAMNGNYTFDDLKRILYTPVLSYKGKLTMSNGEKFVKCGAFALRYTE